MQSRPKLPRVLYFELGAFTPFKPCFFEIVEYRCPKAGEFYVSGAIPKCYKARSDLPSAYWIIRLIYHVECVTEFRRGSPITTKQGDRP